MPRPGPGAKSPRLQRRLFLERAWQQYVGGIEPRGVREEILRSWRRSRDAYQIDPGLTRPASSIAREALQERHARDEGLRLAAPVLDEFTRRVKLRDHVLAYFDAEGCMLSVDGDRGVAESVAERGYCPGSSWAEESAGTNSAGTALATSKPIEVFAAEHYVAAWQCWSSVAVPIRAPGAATPIGIVAMTGPWEFRRRQAMTFVLALARAIEERLRAAAGIRDEVVRYALRAAREVGDALVAVDSHGRIIAANDAATRWNVLDGGVLAPAARDAVVKALCAPAPRADGEVRLESEGASAVVSPVRYEGSRIGAIVRISPSALRTARSGALDRSTGRYDFRCILGTSPPLRHAVELAMTAARNDLPVVLTGESGTGKELFAQAIHAGSSRCKERFVAVSCGSIPAELLEAELFGYEPGTFTGARREGNPGRFEEAAGGSLFLDDVTELAPAAQTALLRVLQEREVVRLGGSTPRPLDVRVLAATNEPLEEEMRSGHFRSDLYYRLNVLGIAVPPLRERGEDVLLLARAFLEEIDVERRGLTLSPDALEALRAHDWPGNVRELKNVILRAAAVTSRPEITARDLVFGPVTPSKAEPRHVPQESSPELERVELMTTLDACAWNFRRTAHQLGISRMTLYRWLRKYGISRSPPAPQ
jgi:sigma-54 dependent transcriptional regulator, acetoin dehydrogenase operon transcriptional activator AcoR